MVYVACPNRACANQGAPYRAGETPNGAIACPVCATVMREIALPAPPAPEPPPARAPLAPAPAPRLTAVDELARDLKAASTVLARDAVLVAWAAKNAPGGPT